MARIENEHWRDPKGRSLVVRSCDKGDGEGSIAFIRTIAAETHFTNNTVDRLFSAPDEIERKWVEAHDSPNEIHLAAFDGYQMVGQLACGRLAPNHPFIGHIARFGMMVLRDYWGSGVAPKLVRGMETFAAAQRIVRIEALVRADNGRARAFYRKYGFLEEGRRIRAAFIDGAWIDDLYIGKVYEWPPTN